MTQKLPRGIRNFNPGNIEIGDPWQGLRPEAERNDPRFAQFASPVWGIRALARTLITYQDKYGIRTVRRIVSRWAPPFENNTDSYINVVAAMARVLPDEKIDLHNYCVLRPILEAIIRHENGSGPLATANTWYSRETIDEGLRLAGVVKPSKEMAKVPVTKETVGAAATGALGAAQIAEVVPAILAAIQQNDAHLSSGSIVRIALGVMTIGLAAFIAYSQVAKHKQGVVA